MRRLLDIIAEDQETILSKDKSILALQNLVKEKDEFIKREYSGISKQEMETMFTKTLDEKDKELLNVKNEMKLADEETESSLCSLKIDLEEQKTIAVQKDLEIQELINEIETQMQLVKTHEALKIKCGELMRIILKQNSDMETVKNDIATHEVVVSRNEILQKEVLVLKVAIQQKDLDIKSINELLARKEKVISQNKTTNEEHINKLGRPKQIVQNTEMTEDNQEIIQNLQQKIINEQEINDQSEEEIIQLRIELDNLKKEIDNNSGSYNHINILKLKDEEIDKLKSDILQEQQIIAHVQVIQEKEIIEKEKEISVLNQILKEEREEWLIKQKEIEKLRGLQFQAESIDESIDTSLSMTLLQSEDTETVTIQEDFSDDEDDEYVLIEDLENDEDNIESCLNDLISKDISLG